MKRTRKPKPRPTYVLEPLIANLEHQRRTVMQKYTATEYERRADIDRRLNSLYWELQEAKKMYLK